MHRLGGQVDVLAPQRHQVAVGTGQKQHVRDHALQPLQLLQVGVQRVLVLVDAALTRQRDLGLEHQVVERRAQFVRDVGREVLERVKRRLQASEHQVDRLQQPAHLGGRIGDVERLAQPLRADPLGLARGLADRRQAAACDQPAQRGTGRHAEQAGDQQAGDEALEDLLCRVDMHADVGAEATPVHAQVVDAAQPPELGADAVAPVARRVRDRLAAFGGGQRLDLGRQTHQPARALAQAEPQVGVTDADVGHAMGVGDDALAAAELAQQVHDDLGLAVDLLAVARLQLVAQHPAQAAAEQQQQQRRAERVQQRDPRGQAQPREPARAARHGAGQARSSST